MSGASNDTLVGRLRFDAARCELQFSKGVAANIEEAAAEIERLREDVARIKIQRNNALLDMEEFMNKAAAAESSLSEAVKFLNRYLNETPLGHQPHMIAQEVETFLSAIRSRAAVLEQK